MPKYKLAVSLEAANERRMILAYSLQHWGPYVAAERRTKLNVALDRIKRFPELGTTAPRLSRTFRRVYVEPHFIYYHIEGNTIFVDHFIHHREDPIAEF